MLLARKSKGYDTNMDNLLSGWIFYAAAFQDLGKLSHSSFWLHSMLSGFNRQTGPLGYQGLIPNICLPRTEPLCSLESVQIPIPFDNHLQKTVVPPLSSQLVYVWRPLWHFLLPIAVYTTWKIGLDCKEQVFLFWSLTACYAVTSEVLIKRSIIAPFAADISPHSTGLLL